jgi:hypothetical protein
MCRHKNITILQVSIAGRGPETVQQTRKPMHQGGAAQYAQLCGATIRLLLAVIARLAFLKTSIESSKYAYIFVNIIPV